MNFIYVYLIGFIIFLLGLVFSEGEIGFRDRVKLASLWFIWVSIISIGVVVTLIYAFLKNSTIDEASEKVLKIKVFRKVFYLFDEN